MCSCVCCFIYDDDHGVVYVSVVHKKNLILAPTYTSSCPIVVSVNDNRIEDGGEHVIVINNPGCFIFGIIGCIYVIITLSMCWLVVSCLFLWCTLKNLLAPACMPPRVNNIDEVSNYSEDEDKCNNGGNNKQQNNECKVQVQQLQSCPATTLYACAGDCIMYMFAHLRRRC